MCDKKIDKTYEIIPISDRSLLEIFKQSDKKFQNEFDEFREYFNQNYQEKLDGKSKIIPQNSYKIFVSKTSLESRKTGKFYQKFKELNLGQIPYCDYFFTFFNGDIAFGIKLEKPKNLENLEGYNKYNKDYSLFLTYDENNFCKCKNLKQIFDFSSEKRAFKLAVCKKSLEILNSTQKDILDINNLKALTMWLLSLSFDMVLKRRSKIDFYHADLNEILEIKKSILYYKSGFDCEADSDKTETLEIFNLMKEVFDIDNKIKEFLEYAKELFEIKRDEFYIKLEQDRENSRLAENQRAKKMQKIVALATFVTIMTLISVIVDIFNLIDKIKPFFKI